MLQEKFETGMYIIDANFKILNINERMKELYSSVNVGDTCYKAIALQECQCAVCPLLQDDALFYNPLRKEWISANAATIDYPGHGKCYNVQFHIRHNIADATREELQEDNMDEHIMELSGGALDVAAIGSYCESGAPISYVNEQLVKLMGYDSIEEMRTTVDGMVFNTIHPEDVEKVANDLTECAMNGGTFETTYRLRSKDRLWIWVFVRGKRVQVSSGAYVLICVITEMNEFLKRQNELQQENEELLQKKISSQAVMASMPSGYHRCADDEGYSFLFVSKSFEEVVGYTAEQLREELDNKFINLVIEEDIPRFAQLERALKKSGNADTAYRIRRRDGQVRWVQDSTMAVELEGEPGFQCTIADITDFVEQLEELSRQKAQFDMVAENIPCGYHRCTVDNGFRLEFVSDNFLEIMGYDKREELLDKPFIDFVFEDDKALFMKHEPVLARDGKVELVYRILRKDGTVRWVKDSTMRIRYNGKETYQCILADITEHIESLNEARNQAEASNQAKSAFLFNASHDIRTPMNAIQGFANIIADNVENPVLVRDAVKKLKNSGDVLLTLMNDVLELSRIEQGKETVNRQPLDMQNHVEKLYEMIAQEMQESKINFRMENSLEHSLVFADDLKMTRIAMNFLSNARKFTPPGGSVTFGITEGNYDGKRATYTLFVQDTGIGMSKEFQEHAFEQFERERTSTVSGVTGSGLGLSITKKLADLLGGTCAIESELGKGTKMSCAVTLNLAEEKDFHPENSNSDADFTGKRILLVEDNDFNREIAKYVFEGVGFEVDEATNGVECIEKLSHNPGRYDLVLMDIQMPVMDGYTATKEIRNYKDPVISNIPIIAMTANAFDEDRKKCLEVGMDGHIGKPLEAKAVIKELMRVKSLKLK